jgi:low affinity Fe/Cu permease
MSELVLGLLINAGVTAVIVVFAVVLGNREDREAAGTQAKSQEELRRAS